MACGDPTAMSPSAHHLCPFWTLLFTYFRRFGKLL